jgi:ribonuclease HII
MKSGIRSFKHELQYYKSGRESIIGCDEVGRGCLAGPVVAAAVVFDWSKPEDIRRLARLAVIHDSKKLTAEQREFADKLIRTVALKVSVGVVSVKVIDKINILQASLRAMKRGIAALCPDSEERAIILIDGNQKIPGIMHAQETVIGGDGKVFSIAAASIVAKVYRDKLMAKLHQGYPVYGWDKNKGYGTPTHKKALKKHGITEHHRVSFVHL